MYTRIGYDPLLMRVTKHLLVTVCALVTGKLKGLWFSQFQCDE